MPSKRGDFKTPGELAKYIGSKLTKAWNVSVDEVDSSMYLQSGRIHRYRYYRACCHCSDPVTIFATVHADTVERLRVKVEDELWHEIAEQFRKQAVQWQTPPDPDCINQPPAALTGPQRTLTFQP